LYSPTEPVFAGELVLVRHDNLSVSAGAVRNMGFAALATLVICCVTLTLTGCGGKEPTRQQSIERYSSELREAVSGHVHDEQRRSQMLVIVDQVETLNHRFNNETAEFIESYRKLNADYDAARPAFDQLFADYSAKRVRARGEALDLHFQLASLATEGEWNSIAKAEIELYEEVNEARPASEDTK
jgi:hypothetical protein